MQIIATALVAVVVGGVAGAAAGFTAARTASSADGLAKTSINAPEPSSSQPSTEGTSPISGGYFLVDDVLTSCPRGYEPSVFDLGAKVLDTEGRQWLVCRIP